MRFPKGESQAACQALSCGGIHEHSAGLTPERDGEVRRIPDVVQVIAQDHLPRYRKLAIKDKGIFDIEVDVEAHYGVVFRRDPDFARCRQRAGFIEADGWQVEVLGSEAILPGFFTV